MVYNDTQHFKIKIGAQLGEVNNSCFNVLAHMNVSYLFSVMPSVVTKKFFVCKVTSSFNTEGKQTQCPFVFSYQVDHLY